MVFFAGLTEEKVNAEDWTLVTLCVCFPAKSLLVVNQLFSGSDCRRRRFSIFLSKRKEEAGGGHRDFQQWHICLSRSNGKQFSGAHRPCLCMCSFNLPTCSTANILASRVSLGMKATTTTTTTLSVWCRFAVEVCLSISPQFESLV